VAASAIGRVGEERIVLAAVIFRAAVVETGMPSEGGVGDTTARMLAQAATAALPAWDLEEAAGSAAAAGAAGDADESDRPWEQK